ncbi:beta-1,6-N-acetylglucosaminyltransferase [Mixta calida]|uniref:beta-1,6-N-acetylglucosaminyltransferase n=1 Tax=Mixta calida TaxID=665913 RepID=UPI002FDE8288
MRLVYLIQCHKNFEQVKLLISSLKILRTDYVVVHVDAKNVLLKKQLHDFYDGVPNINVLHDPVSVHWSGVSQIHATLKMIQFLYNNSIDYDYCSLLSGEDLVFDIDDFKKYLSMSEGKSFLEFRMEREKYFWRINKYNFFRNNKLSQKFICRFFSFIIIKFQLFFNIKRNNFKESDIYLGSQWFTINKAHMDVIYNFLDEDFVKRFKFTSCCDEHFFQILFKRLIDKKHYASFNLRYVFFRDGNNSPEYLGMDKLKELRHMNGIFIARKVKYETLIQYVNCFKKE